MRERAKQVQHIPYSHPLKGPAVHLYEDLRAQVGRLYLIVVHGTTFGSDAGDWWKRVSNDKVHFSSLLTKELQGSGIPFKVWQNCEDFAVSEFSWSGENTHEARIDAGRSLGQYVNDAHTSCIERYGHRPLFLFVGHSHGGNVILCAQRHLLSDVRVLSIDCLGTPFFLYHSQYRIWPYIGKGVMRDVFANIYIQSELTCHRLRIWSTDSFVKGGTKGFDEIQLLLLYLTRNDFLREKLLAYVRRKASDSSQYAPFPITYSWVIRRFWGHDNLPARLHWFERIPPPSIVKVRNVRARSRTLLSQLIRAGTFIIAPFFCRLLSNAIYGRVTGLDPSLFSPSRFVWSSVFGIDYDSIDEIGVPVTEPSDARPDPPAPDWDGKQKFDDYMGSTIESYVQTLLARLDLLHSSYYVHKELIRQLAVKIWSDLQEYYPQLVK